ncbi:MULTISPECIES: hypothetical protein [Flavobacterium]|jgi:hypothetical protein|uniref:hypothetical protein n=1 Tax=Flavobacterium TaxID=237 RepID=UPI0006FE9AF3|nr:MULTISPECIES: hypothetical protein [Flavobacterium]MBU7570800.1 hypothetical protein [Flavobacterium sp.]PZO23651.1 MAG: hypothetical protein DCE86_17485 [Flavobacteriaceae bacterium]PZQ92250.1 MAG: hypothetical protein DI548_01360 [Flavobacterium johnsoniae]KQS50111.1 hypothetical protein ASG38_03795 [Flavobacterium sp. Leaf359]MBL7866869.1 hypothetical protein [Flavobacterium lindanitolerans]
MLKDILKLDGVQELTKNEQTKVNGGGICPKTVEHFGVIGAAAHPNLFGLMCAKEIAANLALSKG